MMNILSANLVLAIFPLFLILWSFLFEEPPHAPEAPTNHKPNQDWGFIKVIKSLLFFTFPSFYFLIFNATSKQTLKLLYLNMLTFKTNLILVSLKHAQVHKSQAPTSTKGFNFILSQEWWVKGVSKVEKKLLVHYINFD